MGVTRQVGESLLADRIGAFRRRPGNQHCRFRVESVLSFAEERDCRQQGRVPFAAHHEPADRT